MAPTQPKARFWRDAGRIAGLIRPEASKYAIGLGSLFIVNLADVLAPLFLAVAIDLTKAELGGGAAQMPPIFRAVGFGGAAFTVLGAVLLYLVLHIVANMARYPMLMFSSVPSHRIGQSLRNRLVAHLLRLSRPFYDRSKSGDLMSLATSDIGAMRMMLGPGVLIAADTIFLAAMVLVVMLTLSPSLTLVTLLPLPLLFWFTNKMSHREYDLYESVQESLASLTERTRESYAGIRIIQGYAIEVFDRDRFGKQSWGHYAKNLALARIRALFDPTLDLMLGASSVLVLIFGGMGVARGEITLGTFVAFLFLVGYLAGPMIGFGWSVSLFQRGRASMSRLQTLLDERVEILEAEQPRTADGPGAISVRDLHFVYAGAPPEPEALEEDSGEVRYRAQAVERPPIAPGALHGISFEVSAGSTLGVIGPVGSGKSTLINLLVRLYDPPPGAILLDGVDIRELGLESLRARVAVVPQDTFLFSTTVARNILLAASGDASADSFASLAQIHSEIDHLPKGYDTLLGERGVNLSGGQRQRVAIARAIATDPRVLVLDDCLSAVDARTEEAILGSLREVFAGRTGIVVSHRVRAVAQCDHIVVLENGRVVQSGTHAQLLAQPGYYATIATQQMAAEVFGGPAALDEPATRTGEAA